MPTAKQFRAVEIDDAKVYEMTADTGAAPTYASGIDIPAMVELSVTEVTGTKEWEGDSVVYGSHSKVLKVTFDLKCNAVPLDVIAIWTGSTLASAGTTPNQTNTLPVLSTDLAKYWKITGRWLGVEGHDDATGKGLQLSLLKCKMTGGLKYAMNGDVASVSGSGTAYATLSSKKIREFVGQETQGTVS